LTRKMTLTPDIVARVHRTIVDPGPSPDLVYHSEEYYDAVPKICSPRILEAAGFS